jgi:hypothetical protein
MFCSMHSVSQEAWCSSHAWVLNIEINIAYNLGSGHPHHVLRIKLKYTLLTTISICINPGVLRFLTELYPEYTFVYETEPRFLTSSLGIRARLIISHGQTIV